jgi:hypothetical protein
LNGKSGVEPRPDDAAYPAQDATAGISMGAAVLTRRQIRQVFGSGLKGQYIVVEIGIFPQSQVAVSPDQFRMRVGNDPGLLRPVDAVDVARSLLGDKKVQAPPQTPGHVQVDNTETIGYEHGPNGRGGVYVGSGTAVAVGDPQTAPQTPQPPAATIPNAPDLERLLVEHELPDTKTSAPVAGYLYFRRPDTRQRGPSYGITWYGPIAQLHVSVLSPMR